jgi:hypothetical protein
MLMVVLVEGAIVNLEGLVGDFSRLDQQLSSETPESDFACMSREAVLDVLGDLGLGRMFAAAGLTVPAGA